MLLFLSVKKRVHLDLLRTTCKTGRIMQEPPNPRKTPAAYAGNQLLTSSTSTVAAS
jgi:hypothetical protein